MSSPSMNWELEALELGARVTGYVALVDLYPESIGLSPTDRAKV